MAIESPIYVDANILIYALETDGDEGVLARRWLMQIDRGRLLAATSELTILEVLPRPISGGNAPLVDGYRRILKGTPTLRVRPVSRAVIETATTLRAELGIDAPDAIHVATAFDAGCRGFLTNDTRLRLPSQIVRHRLPDVAVLYR